MRNADELQESFASPLEFKQTCTIIISAYRHTIATLPPFNKIQIQKTTRRWFHDTAYCFDFILIFPMVPGAGLEPAQRERRGILNPLCLPIPPSGLGKKVEARSGVEPD